MQAAQIDLLEMFPVNTTLIIPVYQRNYDWKKIHCEKLFADIEKLVGNEELHFLGAIVYQEKKTTGMFKESIIVDGQQRISSLILLAKALYDSTDDENIKHALSVNFFKNPIPNPKYKFKLQPTEYDINIFTKLMEGENLSAEEQNSRLYENYKLFKEKISKSAHSVQALHDAMYSLRFVRMIIENENPQQIFESLNSTGKGLTETELIRNFLLMDLERETQEKFYKNYWLKMELLLKTSETFNKFILHYLIMKRKSSKDMQGDKNIHNSQNAMYETFKKYFKDNYSGDKTEQIAKLLDDMYHNAQFYEHLLFDENTNFSELSPLDKKFYELIYLLKSATMQIILMGLNEQYNDDAFDENTFIEMVNALISFKCRSKICRQTGIDTDQTAGNVLSRLEKYDKITIDTFWKAITEGKGKYTFPSNEDFKQALMSTELNLSLKDTCKYLLYVLAGETDFSNYGASVELVMPKKLTVEWTKYLHDKNDSQAEQFVNSLGNLVLVDNAKKNAAFSDKQVHYKNSRFNLTREVSQNSVWTSRQIRRRAESLAKKAVEIWEFHQKDIPKVNENIFTLDSDFDLCTGEKPAIVSISGTEYKVDKWTELLSQIIGELYALDKDIFNQVVNSNISARKNLFASSAENLRTPIKIDENYYMESSMDTKVRLKILRAFVEKFDNLSGTNFKDEIWFTLKD